MEATAVVQLVLALAEVTPQVLALAQQAKNAMSATDQASVDAAIAQLMASANADLSQAETDLDNAAKS